MNWKRPLALSTAALTLGTALAACGNPTAAAPDPTPTPAAGPAWDSPDRMDAGAPLPLD